MLGQSTVALMLAYAFLFFLQWGVVQLLTFLSGFHGNEVWHVCSFSARSLHWEPYQIVVVYLVPVLFFLLLLLILDFRVRPEFPVKRSRPVLFFYGWFYLLLLIRTLFIPAWETINKTGFYYGLEWFSFHRDAQGLVVFGMVLLFLVNLAKVAPHFSTGLGNFSGKFLKPKVILPRLLYLWYGPLFIFSICLFMIAWVWLHSSGLICLSGVIFVITVNSFIMARYHVIVK